MENRSSQVVRTSEVIGKKVISSHDKENLGKIEEIVLDKLCGEVRYAVLSLGGFMGVGKDYYAIPWRSLEFSANDDAFRVKIDKEKLKGASGFNKTEWPDFADVTWIKSIDDFFNLDIVKGSPAKQQQVDFISEGGNSQPLHKQGLE